MKPKVILCPEGWAVNLEYAVNVSPVEFDKGKRCVSFFITMVNDNNEYFWYYLTNYLETKEELIAKVNTIRDKILCIINDGEMPKEILGNIQLAKKNA